MVMENNRLKENIRKTVKEKIAVSYIRMELDMKTANSKKVIYTISSICAVFILCLGIAFSTSLINNKPNTEIGKRDGVEELYVEKENLKMELNINKLNKLAIISADADIKEKEIDNLPKKIEFINQIAIPEEYRLESKYAVYTKENLNAQEYNILHDYVFTYRKDSTNKIIITFSEIDKPLRDYYISNEHKISKIGDTELIISQYEDRYIIEFSYQNLYFDIETVGITENELVSLLQSIIKEINMYSDSKYSNEDKDVAVKEQINEIVNGKYPVSYGGKYVDNNGNNVVWIYNNNEANRREVCKFLGITESKTIFKDAKYSYNYLEDLQSKISQKMSSKEFPFVTTSTIMETTNNIKVTVTSNEEEDLKKIRKLDLIGGTIEIDYNTNSIVKEDLLVKTE